MGHAMTTADATEWHNIPTHRSYVIDGVRHAEVWRDGRGVIIPLHEIGDAELAQLRGAA
jgi:hypothetical protein